ncbi:MAG: ATP-binding protein [Candidatus Aminicenantes bacterium]|jgi:signal transduction histidine kinase/DNA-binding NarL/FixJ family response regulator
MKVYWNCYRIFSFFMVILLSLLCRASGNLFPQVRCRFLFSPFEVLNGSSLSRGYQHTGFKYFRNYSREDYNLQPQNWFILQDKENGFIYIANQEGLLIYDGVSWQSIDIPNKSVRSLAIDDTKTIYVGGRNEFGRLILDKKGSLTYESLRGYIENNNQIHFTNVWKIHPTKKAIYFHTSEFLFRWDPDSKKIETIDSNYPFNASFMCAGKLFIRQQNIGLREMVNGKLKTVPGGEKFANKAIFMMVPYDNTTKTFLIGTKFEGLYKYDYIKEKIAPFLTDVDDYIKAKQLSHGIRLLPSSTSPGEPGGFALATHLGGLFIIDCKGRLKYKFNKTSGLQDNNINYVYEDVEGNLWLALNKGISKIEYASPISICDDRSGLTGLVLSVIKHHNDLYVGTTDGLFSLPSSSRGGFIPVPGIPGYCFSLLSIGDSLLAATFNGVFLVKPVVRRIIKSASYVLQQSRKNKNRVWMETNNGLNSLYFHPGNKNKIGKWVEEHHRFKGLTADIRTIVEEKNGDLWLGTLTKGVLKVEFPVNGTMADPVVTSYYTSHGLPEGEVHVFWAAGHVMFAAPGKGIFRFNKINKRFNPDSTLGAEFAGGSRGVFRIVEDNNKNIWFHSDDQNFQAIPGPNNTFIIKSEPFLRIPRTQVNIIYIDPDGSVVWFASHDGLIRFDKTVKKNYHRDFLTIIRRVVANGKLIYDGNKTDTENNLKPACPTFQYKDRNIRFEFASTFFEGESSTQYRHLLEGYDKHWSEWTLEPNIDYTNLDAGQYTFKVQAKSVYNHPGSIPVFQFKVLSPWYKTWWAFTIHISAGLLLISLVVKWRSGKLAREKQKLERIVKARTKEIDEKNQQLEKQTIQLKEQSEKLKEVDKVKSRFFTNISHEFRTPLTLIMSPLEQMISETRDNEKQKKLNLMMRNSQRLLGLINQLMELARFESGKLKLQASRQDIILFLKGIVASFDPVASKNELDLSFQAAEENIDLYFDQAKLEEILFNLLSNAIKFTPPGGKITVKVTKNLEKEENFPSGSADISVEDTGPGIPRDQVNHIFERFYQSDITYEHHLKGSGIGLSIAKELVELHHGTINVHSHENLGTEFIIRLPLGHAHLSPEEIIEPPVKPYQHKTVKDIPSVYITEKDPDVHVHKGIKAGETDEGKVKENSDPINPGKNIILIVEDNTDFRQYLKKALEPLYMVIEAVNGQEGVQKAQDIIPDLIISDIMMPEIDGCELCRIIKNNILTSHIPIILLTARSSEEGIIQGLETGADDYITKPFYIKILCARIKNLIDLRTHMQQTLKRQMTRQPVKISMSRNDKVFFKEITQLINENISDPDFNVTQMCKELDMSQPSLYRKIYALSGESPTEFIRSYRLKRGAELLRDNPAMTVLEVALEVGFSSANYFAKCFKKMFHQPPSTYQASEAN